jgi:multiple sugar transport system permease protein
MSAAALWRRPLLTVVALGFAAIYLFPLYWMYVTSLKSQTEIFANPPTFWPQELTFAAYSFVWTTRTVGTFMWNSLVIAVSVTALSVVLGTGVAYVLARHRNVWVDVALFLVLMLQVLPGAVMATPLFVAFNQLGLLELPRTAVVLAATAKSMPFFVVLVRASFMTVPRELEEAALVDGTTRFGAFWRIVLPLARNGILVCAILIFMQAFGEFIFARSMIQDANLQPASVGLASFVGPQSRDWNAIMAYAAMYVTPILAMFVLVQRRIVSGLTAGALK